MEIPEKPSAVQSHTSAAGLTGAHKGEDLDKGVNEAAAFPEGSLPVSLIICTILSLYGGIWAAGCTEAMI